ncbi:hypothetical protein GGF46_003572 [Coemansia sp. RSA 552]|nr:hypothetical protein GGF46_003572 [Coemansia sp. RSA 552]
MGGGTSMQERGYSHYDQLQRVPTSGSLASANRYSTAGSPSSQHQAVGELPIRQMSPVLSHSSNSSSDEPLLMSLTSTVPLKGMVAESPHRPLPPLPQSAQGSLASPAIEPETQACRLSAGLGSPPRSAPLTSKKMLYGIYPRRRDRSMTVPSNVQAGTTPPPVPGRIPRKSSVPQHTPNPELSRLARDIASVSSSRGTPERLDFSISRSPLFQPQEDPGSPADPVEPGAGVRGEADTKLNDDLLMLPLLPSPADTAGTSNPVFSDSSSSQEALAHTPLSRILSAEAGETTRAPTVVVEGSSNVAIDPQYASVMMNSDKLKHYLKQVSDNEEAAEVTSAMRKLDDKRKLLARGSSSVDCMSMMQVLDEGPRSKRGTIKQLNDSGVQIAEGTTRHLSTSAMQIAEGPPGNFSGGAVQIAEGPTRNFSGGGVGSANQSNMGGFHRSHSGILRRDSSSLNMSSSQLSLPIIHEAHLAGQGGPAYSFGHSRYSLINQDGSLNLLNIQFEQLDGYQKRLSGAVSPPPPRYGRGEGGKVAERLMRKASDGGRFWNGGVSSDPAIEGNGVRQRRLVRKARKKQPGVASAPASKTDFLGVSGSYPSQQSLSVNLWTNGGMDEATQSRSNSLFGSSGADPQCVATAGTAIA